MNHRDTTGCKYFAWQDEVNPIKSVSSIIRMLDYDLHQGQSPEINSPIANLLLSRLECMEERMSKVKGAREHALLI
ncbi:hypothetical protein QJS10_CPA08g00642 [Acorus calamus]|uniref:Uncharacterized protein n=1 Tax=Acorus calamus TaxID=4465 RepID=A0AAV9E955_ACOCL|nr:hypothetical protein QJS10_CPA08g00642 [Acorus calamus]